MARNFAGGSDSVDCGSSSKLNPTGAMTIHARAKLNSTSGAWIVARDDNALGRAYSFGHQAGSYQIQVNGTPVGGGTLSVGIWYSLCAVNDGSGNWTLYVNGISGGTGSPGNCPSTTGQTCIGRRTYAGLNENFVGDIADVAIWNTSLRLADVISLARGFSSTLISPASLVFNVPLIRDVVDLRGNSTISITGTAIATHPAVIMPRRRNSIGTFTGVSPPPPPVIVAYQVSKLALLGVG